MHDLIWSAKNAPFKLFMYLHAFHKDFLQKLYRLVSHLGADLPPKAKKIAEKNLIWAEYMKISSLYIKATCLVLDLRVPVGILRVFLV